MPEGIVCGTPPEAGPAAGVPEGFAPPAGGTKELLSGGTEERRPGGCGRMLGGGGGVRMACGADSVEAGKRPVTGDSAGAAGRERIGGGGGPDGRAKGGAAGSGALAGGGVGVIPGKVLRGACGAAVEAGRGGANDGRGATATPEAFGASGASGASGGALRGGSSSLISPLPIAKIDAEKKPGILRETSVGILPSRLVP